MLIGVPKEIKTREYRVAATPAGVRQLVAHGHRVLVQHTAGEGSGISDELYVAAGATIVPSAADAWGAEMVIKVKEPLAAEYGYFREGLILYTYLHLAAEPALGTMVAPAATYCSSLMPLPSPAVCWTSTRWPCATSWRTPAGVAATRYSRVLISFGTPI